MKKLTIGIPTWNRAEEIRDALDSVIFQLQEDERLKNEVEIFISINASTDNTEDVLRELSSLESCNYIETMKDNKNDEIEPFYVFGKIIKGREV